MPRVEDPALVTGEERFVADLPIPALEAVFVRSAVAHGEVLDVDLEAARSSDGVAGAFAAADLPDLPSMPPMPGVDVPDAMSRPSLARERVRFVGEPVAVVVADDLARAQDAAELVLVDVDPLPAVLDPTEAATSAIELFPGAANVVAVERFGDDVSTAMDAAPVTVELELHHPRVAHAAMETRRILVVPQDDGLAVWCSHQAPHRLRDNLAAAFGLGPALVRVVVPAVGGAFGGKSQAWPEYLVVAHLARRLARPIRWVEGRSEAFLAGPHGRGQNQRLRIGAERDGRIVALDAEIDGDAGAYPHTGGFIATNTAWMLSGPYRIPHLSVRVRTVVTNAPPTSPYRGAGRPEAAFALERLMDELARRLELDPAQIRRRNLLHPDEFPYRSPTGARYDSANHPAAFELALERAGYDEVRRRQAARGPQEPLLGIGIGCFVERSGSGIAGTEYGAVEIRGDGPVRAFSGSSSQGQGHRTAFAQVVAAALDLDPADVEVVQGDTDQVVSGTGTFGSRSIQVGGSALHGAAVELSARARAAAAEHLEAAEEDLSYGGGMFSVTGSPDRAVTLAELAGAAGGLAAEHTFTSPQAFPYGTYVAVVEVDRETGAVHVRRIVAVDDCGVVINPLLAHGQVEGALAQGVGQALYEEVVFDEDGQPLATSLATYGVPSSAEAVETLVLATETPSPDNPLGAKGIGESGAIGAPPAIANAVADALRDHDTRGLRMPLTPERILRILRGQTTAAASAVGRT
ncbi:MAG TPA: xanthine dehydrogenase family protein molybdopterin-binding subunit [Actinomycetota bacterium]|nr:xanthine dehydrogenase family protein molybdopterin-binding subunit [Actinomycetota bacterium]